MVTSTSIRQRVFKELDKNPLLTAKSLAKLLDFTDTQADYYKGYLRTLKADWKRYYQKQQGSIRCVPDGVHNAFFRGVLPVGVVEGVRRVLFEVWGRAGFDRWVFPERPLSASGWRLTRFRNKALLYRSSLGRVRLFQNGTVELFVRKPASLGKCKQLFSDAFTRHYLVSDLKVVDAFFGGLLRRFHATYRVGERLPYVKVTTFEDTHRFTFVSGDRTHPDCYEFILEYHAEVEKARAFLDALVNPGNNGNGAGKALDGRDYSV